MKQFNVSGEKMRIMKDDIIEALDNLSTIAEENAASTQQVISSIEEQTNSIEEIANVGQNILTSSDKLNSKVSLFEI